MSVNPPDISTPLLLLDPVDWPAAMRGEYAGMPLIFDLHPQGLGDVSPDAGKTLQAFLQQRGQTAENRPVTVRIGGFGDGRAERDLAHLESGWPEAILLSGCRDAADIQKLDVLLGVFEASAGLATGSTKILAECGGEVTFFLSPHSLAGKSERLRGLVLDGPALAQRIGAGINDTVATPPGGPLSFARGICVLKAAEAQIGCYEIPLLASGLADIRPARAKSMTDGFNDIVVRRPALLTRGLVV